MRRRDIPHSRERLRRKRNYALKNAALIVFALVLFMGTLVWILSDERVRISRVDVTGNVVIQDHEIEARVKEVLRGKYLFLFPKDSIFLYPHTALYEAIQNDFKRIVSLTVERAGFSALAIKIAEREPHALWCGDEYRANEERACYFMDSDGYIFTEAPQFTGSVYFEFYGPRSTATSTEVSPSPVGTNYKTPEEFHKIVAFKDNIARLGIPAGRMLSLPFGDYELRMDDGGKIYWNVARDPLDLASDFEAAYRTEIGDPRDGLLRDKIEYIDTRFANKIFFKRR